MLIARLTILMLLIAGTAASIEAQTIGTRAPSRPPQIEDELPQPILEHLAKQKIEEDKKAFKELTDNSAEVTDLSKSLFEKFSTHGRLSNDDRKSVQKIERLVRKIRSDLGGSDSAEERDRDASQSRTDLKATLEKLSASAAALSNEIRLCSRFSVSVTAIEITNRLLDLLDEFRNQR